MTVIQRRPVGKVARRPLAERFPLGTAVRVHEDAYNDPQLARRHHGHVGVVVDYSEMQDELYPHGMVQVRYTDPAHLEELAADQHLSAKQKNKPDFWHRPTNLERI